MKNNITFKLIPKEEIFTIIPLIELLGNFKVSEKTLKSRFLEIVDQNYECVGVYEGAELIGCSGLWFQTRHYAGRSIEMDHVIIKEGYRSHGLGKKLIDFVVAYALNKNCLSIELNSYVHNFPSHKFFNNQGFEAKGYHFVKKIGDL